MCYQHGAAVTLTVGSKRRSLLMAGDDDEMFMTRSLNVTPKKTEQHLIVRSDKSIAYVTNKKTLRSTFCTIEANYWQTGSIARPLCDSRATCYQLRSRPKRTGQNLIARNSRSEAEVSNKKILHSRYCTTEANYRRTQSIARPLCDSTASCLYESYKQEALLSQRGRAMFLVCQ